MVSNASPSVSQPRSLEVEQGYVNQFGDPISEMWFWDLHEQVPDLKWPLSLITYERMPREDSRVWSLLAAIKLPIRRTQWRIDPNNAPARVVKFIADEFDLPVVGVDKPKTPRPRQKGRFSWHEHLNEALSCLRYGHSVFEQVYRAGDDGLLHIRKLAPRPQATIARWNVARDGGLASIWQEPPAGLQLPNTGLPAGAQNLYRYVPGGYVDIGVDRLVVYRNEPDPGVWIGTSLLRPAYKHWILKDELIRIEAAAARRNGIGVPFMQPPEGPDSQDPKKLAEYSAAAQKFRSGMSAGLALPAGAKFSLVGVSGNLPDLRHAIEYHDKMIALSGLAHFLNLDRGGSYALASVQADAFVQSVQTFADQIAETTSQHVIEDLVDLNFGSDVAAPRLVCDEIGSRQDATAAALQMLVAAGLLVPDEALRIFIRQQLGAPAEEPDTAATADNTPPTSPAQPSPPAGGDGTGGAAPAASVDVQKFFGRTGQGRLFDG